MYIVTGGAGFLGSAMIWRMNAVGIRDILVVDNLSTSEKWKNLVNRDYSTYMHRDAFWTALKENALPQNVDGIIHMGACSSTTERDADFLMRNNTQFTIDLCTFAIERNIRCINASSAATYGDGSLGFSDDILTARQLSPLNMYGYSKQLVDLWLIQSNLPANIVSLKFFNVYGPNEYHKDSMRSMVCKAYSSVLESRRIQLFKSDRAEYKDGGQQRDFIYVKDCVEIMFWLLQSSSLSGILNVGTGKARTWNDLARAVFTAMNVTQNIEYIEMPPTLKGKYQYHTEAKMDWLQTSGCPVVLRSLEDGVFDYVTNYLSKPDGYLERRKRA